MLAAIVRASLAHPRIVTALACLIAALGVGGAAFRALRCLSRFRAAARIGADRGARPRCDPGRGAGDPSPRGASGRHRERENGTLHLEPGVIGDAGGLRPRAATPIGSGKSSRSAWRSSPACCREGVGAPLLSPLSSSMEYLVHFGYTSDRLSPVELRDIVQWIVKPQILAVPGVAQAQIFGGEVRERQIEVDPVKLAASGFTLGRCPGDRQACDGPDRRRLFRDATQRIVIRAQAPGRDARCAVRGGGRHACRLPGTPGRRRRRCARAPEPRFGDALIGGKPGILSKPPRSSARTRSR